MQRASCDNRMRAGVGREPKPIAWVHLLERLRKGDHIVTVREVQLEGEGRKDEELRAALRYFHELGEVTLTAVSH